MLLEYTLSLIVILLAPLWSVEKASDVYRKYV
jgi:hypothetical protein